jgi:hypothetical protein
VTDLSKLGALNARQVAGRIRGRESVAVGATTVILKFTAPTNCTTTITVTASVRASSGGAAYGRVASFRRGTGSQSQTGATASIYTLESDAAWDLAIAGNGTDIEVTATGSASLVTTWSFVAELVFSPETLPGDAGAGIPE